MTEDLSENPAHIQYLCSRLSVGRQRGELCRVFGGFHHKMWRLVTDRGTYAVKQLSVDTDVSQPAVTNHYNVTEAIAEEFAGHGISAIFALNREGKYLQLVDGVGYLVYPWTDAVAVGKNDISEQHATDIARVLATIHDANLDVPALLDAPFDTHSEGKIILLVQGAVRCNIRNAKTLNENLPTILSIAATQEAALQSLGENKVISHGDLDHKNVLWNESGTPVLIDWESVRRVNPTYEILLGALDWSGITATFHYGIFEKLLSSYREAGGVIYSDSIQASFDCILADWLNWLMYNVGRAVDINDQEQHLIGTEQIDLALSAIVRLRHGMPQLLSIAHRESVSHV